MKTQKLFVLDTNVLLHDPASLFHFEEHDVFLPMIVIDELDSKKSGPTELARNARQVSRYLDAIIGSTSGDIMKGIPLKSDVHLGSTGLLHLQISEMNCELPQLPTSKADNAILGVVMFLQKEQPERKVILVSQDINVRIKARALGLAVEDYSNDKVLEDTDVLPTGAVELPPDFWDKHSEGMESGTQAGHTFYNINGPLCHNLLVNQFVYQESDASNLFHAVVTAREGDRAVLRTLTDYTHQKNAVHGITARNKEQNFALNLLMNPEIDFVTLLGQAGTGKTLLTIAAALEQTLGGADSPYSEIIFTRATMPVGEDIGFLPGSEEDKMAPWMGALYDNLEVLSGIGTSVEKEDSWGKAAARDLIGSRIKIKSLNFMRGRTFINKFLIIDEAQNLTPKQMKTLVTRAGPGTKVVCLGNNAQIDTPYLTEASSGLTYVVDRFKGWEHSGHVTLQHGERSRLADYAIEVL